MHISFCFFRWYFFRSYSRNGFRRCSLDVIFHLVFAETNLIWCSKLPDFFSFGQVRKHETAVCYNLPRCTFFGFSNKHGSGLLSFSISKKISELQISEACFFIIRHMQKSRNSWSMRFSFYASSIEIFLVSWIIILYRVLMMYNHQ